MRLRRYEIVSLRPQAGEFLVRYAEDGHEITLNLPAPSSAKEIHRHILRHWPRQRFTDMRVLQEIVDVGLKMHVEIAPAEVEMFALEDIDE